ncbi:MAG: hypothetical protein ABI992_05975 [Chthoniobacterales bacterium]
MPLEDCPTCGYALSIVDHHCRHCAPTLLSGPRFVRFDPKSLPWLIPTLVALGALGYLVFFR